MEKNILIWLILLLPTYVHSQCNVIGSATPIPFGTFNCAPLPLSPSVGGGGETTITRCFNYTYPGPSQLSYLLVTGLCGPFPLYNTLTFQIYTSNCSSLITSGTIIPIASNNNINNLVVGQTYVICYTWVPNCPQSEACPLIYANVSLPVELVSFTAVDMKSHVQISWSTASQLNTEEFILIKSYDGDSWQLVERVPGMGTTSEYNYYSVYDTDISNGVIYYKLIEKTYDGVLSELDMTSIFRSSPVVFDYRYDILGRVTNSGIYLVPYKGSYRIMSR
jgi:hypothetical protein